MVTGGYDEPGEVLREEMDLENLKDRFKTPSQGASTTRRAATSPDLEGLGGLSCEESDVAELPSEDMPRYRGVAPWCVDEGGADRLWEVTEGMWS